jgi:hypothetical protein
MGWTEGEYQEHACHDGREHFAGHVRTLFADPVRTIHGLRTPVDWNRVPRAR